MEAIAIPIKRCTLPNGGQGWKYGDKGKCYKSKKDAIKQGLAIHNGNWEEMHSKLDKGELGDISKAELDEVLPLSLSDRLRLFFKNYFQ